MDKDEIVRDITRRITSEELHQGHWLVERELCEEYGVSRTPVREILRVLSTSGLVEQIPGKGFRVKQLDFEDIISIFNAREAVECMLARLACNFASPEFLAEISQFRQQLEGVDVQKNIQKAMGLGRNIHDCIADGANNSILAEFYCKLKNLHAFTAVLTRKLPALEENSKRSHLKIVRAIEAHDADRAELMMREHIRLTCKHTIEGYIAQRTGYGPETGEAAL